MKVLLDILFILCYDVFFCTAAAAATFFPSHWYSDTPASMWQSVQERGGGCHLSVKAALPSSRLGVLGQPASELASVTVVEWTLNNRARSSALPAWPAGWLASRRDATGRRPEPATIHYFHLRKSERESERKRGWRGD